MGRWEEHLKGMVMLGTLGSRRTLPGRYLDVEIAEQHAMTLATRASSRWWLSTPPSRDGPKLRSYRPQPAPYDMLSIGVWVYSIMPSDWGLRSCS